LLSFVASSLRNFAQFSEGCLCFDERWSARVVGASGLLLRRSWLIPGALVVNRQLLQTTDS
jgi:hypothetical protein